jgi:hypothetical protein
MGTRITLDDCTGQPVKALAPLHNPAFGQSLFRGGPNQRFRNCVGPQLG